VPTKFTASITPGGGNHRRGHSADLRADNLAGTRISGPERPLTCSSLERTTGFEPATLTLARPLVECSDLRICPLGRQRPALSW
jgi:hypothetical protein